MTGLCIPEKIDWNLLHRIFIFDLYCSHICKATAEILIHQQEDSQTFVHFKNHFLKCVWYQTQTNRTIANRASCKNPPYLTYLPYFTDFEILMIVPKKNPVLYTGTLNTVRDILCVFMTQNKFYGVVVIYYCCRLYVCLLLCLSNKIHKDKERSKYFFCQKQPQTLCMHIYKLFYSYIQVSCYFRIL